MAITKRSKIDSMVAHLRRFSNDLNGGEQMAVLEKFRNLNPWAFNRLKAECNKLKDSEEAKNF